MASGLLVLAGQLDDLKKKYPQFNLDGMSHLKPKYYGWAIKQLLAGSTMEQIVPALETFDKNQVRLKEKDINKYQDLEALIATIQEIGKSKTEQKKTVKSTGAKTLFENDAYILLRIESKQACIQYGTDTKWCITWKDEDYFNKYSLQGVKFYFWINKKLKARDPLQKVAITILPEDAYTEQAYEDLSDGRKLQVWDSTDTAIKASSVPGLDLILHKLLEDSNSAKSQRDLIENIGENPEKYISHKNSKIRLKAAELADPKYLVGLIHDPEEQIRIIVSKRIAPEYLKQMIDDDSYHVANNVVNRLPYKYLPLTKVSGMDGFTKNKVLKQIIEGYDLGLLAETTEYPIGVDDHVLFSIFRGIDQDLLPNFRHHKDSRIRSLVINKIDHKYLPEFVNDPSEDIRINAVVHANPEDLPLFFENKSEVVKQIAQARYKQFKNKKNN
jgi:hypothetical protein